MHPHVQNPAAANCGVPKTDLAGASIYSDNIANLPPIQADPRAELRFAQWLAASVFSRPTVLFQVETKPRRRARA